MNLENEPWYQYEQEVGKPTQYEDGSFTSNYVKWLEAKIYFLQRKRRFK